jgi:muramidase (phage lysozyme)
MIMDKSIPTAAATLLNFIAETEVGCGAPQCYLTVYGHNQGKLQKPLIDMTLSQVIAAQPAWSRRFGSSAAGAYQFMEATLKGLKSELNLLGSTKFSADLQDRLGYHLLKRRGYVEFMGGEIDRTEFARLLAAEWASFPVLAPTQGAHRQLKRGQSYYAGDGLNEALVKPEEVEAVLEKMLPQAPKETVEKPAKKSVAEVAVPAAVIVGGVTIIGEAWNWIAQFPCHFIGLLCGG